MLFSRRARGIQNPERTPTVAEAEIDKNLVKEAALHRHFLAPLLSPLLCPRTALSGSAGRKWGIANGVGFRSDLYSRACRMHVARSCRERMTIVENKGKFIATHATCN